MNKKKIVLISICGVLVFLLGFILIKLPEIKMNNLAYEYVEIYLPNLPSDQATIQEIEELTDKLINENVYKKSSFLSKYQLRFILEKLLAGGGDPKQSCFHEIVCLRLKVLAVLGKEAEYKELFDTYIYDITDGYLSSYMYQGSWDTEENYPLEYNNDIYKIVIGNYEEATANCENTSTKYTLLNQMRYFYQGFEETKDKEVFYTEQIAEFFKSNKNELSEQLNGGF